VYLLISKSSVTKVWKLYKDTDGVDPKPRTQGRKPAFSDETKNKILDKIKEQPDITLEEIIEYFTLKISVSALSRKLKKWGLTFKKKLYFQKNKTVKMFKNQEMN
jgi:transposase